MPSHIFVQLGMWDDVIASNIVAYKAAVDLAEAKNLPRGREDFHTLSWLQYAYLQEGKFDEAQKCVDQAKAVADKDTAPNIRDGYAAMKARQVVESERVGEARAADHRGEGRRRARLRRQRGLPASRPASAPRASAISATANLALEKLKAMRTQAESGSNAYRAKPFAIMEKEVGAGIASHAEGHRRRRAAAEGSDGDRADAGRAVGSARADQAVVRAVRRSSARPGPRRRKRPRSSSSR